MKRVAQYRMAYADIANLFNHASANKGDKANPWEAAGQGCDWDVGSFMTGLMALYYTTKDTTYLNFAKRWATTFNWQACYKTATTDNADKFCCLQTYTEIYQLDPTAANASMIQYTKQCITNYFDVVKPNPTYKNPGGWWWCDALYMAPPAIVRYCKASGETRFLDSLDRYWWSVSGYLYNPTAKLWYRDNGLRSHFWSGGNAWVIGGLVRVLDYMPKTYADRAKWETQFKDMSSAILAQQGFTTPYSGMWTTDMLDHAGSPGAESIGTAFFCYAFAWGVRNGLLDSATYTPAVNKAWSDLIKNIGSDGRLLRCQHVDWGPTNGDLNNSAPEGEGAFLLAGSELYLRAKPGTGVKPVSAGATRRTTALRVRGSSVHFTLTNPATAALKLYAANGRLAADLSDALGRAGAGTLSLALPANRLAPGRNSQVAVGSRFKAGSVALHGYFRFHLFRHRQLARCLCPILKYGCTKANFNYIIRSRISIPESLRSPNQNGSGLKITGQENEFNRLNFSLRGSE
jgi:rhamnogalacturonyl hydrolase YesR